MGLFGGGGILSSVAGVGLDMITGGAYGNNQATQQTNASQMQLANDQMQFQERMSSTAYQRAMADMQRAGLNPMLAYEQGGASAPSGAMATLTAPRPGDVGKGIKETAIAVAGGIADYKQKASQSDLNNANVPVAAATVEKTTANAKESEANAKLAAQQTEKAAHDAREAKARANLREKEDAIQGARQEIDMKAAPLDAIGGRIGEVLGKAGTAYKQFMAPKIPDINVGKGYDPQYNQHSTHVPAEDTFEKWKKNYKTPPLRRN